MLREKSPWIPLFRSRMDVGERVYNMRVNTSGEGVACVSMGGFIPPGAGMVGRGDHRWGLGEELRG